MKKRLEPFTLDKPNIDELAKRLAQLYAGVTLHHSPLFAWVQITNDITILGEDLRRQRKDEAINRAGKALIRLLEFIGYYRYVHVRGRGGSADLVARIFKQKSFGDYLPNELEEGPTRWIIAKYPFACSKCGKAPCHCVIRPWILEKRREEPEPYEAFREKAEKSRKLLKTRKIEPFTLRKMIHHFQKIYGANYYHDDAWKIGMHLSEEMGEATIELGRLELSQLASETKFEVRKALERAFITADTKVENVIESIANPATRANKKTTLDRALSRLKTKVEAKPWEVYQGLVRDKLKEEIADTLGWLCGIIVKLDPELTELKKVPDEFKNESGRASYLCCVWCRHEKCTNNCLVGHAISSEMVEDLTKF